MTRRQVQAAIVAYANSKPAPAPPPPAPPARTAQQVAEMRTAAARAAWATRRADPMSKFNQSRAARLIAAQVAAAPPPPPPAPVAAAPKRAAKPAAAKRAPKLAPAPAKRGKSRK